MPEAPPPSSLTSYKYNALHLCAMTSLHNTLPPCPLPLPLPLDSTYRREGLPSYAKQQLSKPQSSLPSCLSFLE